MGLLQEALALPQCLSIACLWLLKQLTPAVSGDAAGQEVIVKNACKIQLGLVNVTGQDIIVEIAECIGGHGLASVCRLLAEDHAGWSGIKLVRKS